MFSLIKNSFKLIKFNLILKSNKNLNSINESNIIGIIFDLFYVLIILINSLRK